MMQYRILRRYMKTFAGTAVMLGLLIGTLAASTGATPAVTTLQSNILHVWPEEDWNIFKEKMAWADEQRLEELPIREIILQFGLSFQGARYAAHTLEKNTSIERLVVNFREFDCVTFIENMLAMARLIKDDRYTPQLTPEKTRALYEKILSGIRYRDGIIDGYPSRLHYFTDWVRSNTANGTVIDITEDLRGKQESNTINFMSKNPDAYPRLSNPENLNRILQNEAAITETTRHVIAQDTIALVEHKIRDGDIVAMTTSLEGLDVIHAGIAIWRAGQLHILHAPLPGRPVEVSNRTLSKRTLEMRNQTGITVARPLDN
ncbi:MAG: N-acetylmuramoyl-L-alanine amidase-like domain-containing protein [Sneathiella sp.]